MSIFYNSAPQFLDANGDPYVAGKLYFGEENVDPKNNLQTIYLDEALTTPAANPQTLDAFGRPSQGTLYMQESPIRYSLLLEDASSNQVLNIPSATGVAFPIDLTNMAAITVNDSITAVGVTDAVIEIDSGPATTSTGELDFQEDGVSVWRLIREAIVDGGSMILRRLTGTSAPDDPIEFPYTGGAILSWLGTVRVQLTATGTAILGLIEQNPQVLAVGGTFLHAGTAVGETHGITSVANTGTGEYEVTLDFSPVSEVDLCVSTSAELSGAEMITRGVGGAPASGKILVYTSNDAGARANATSFTVMAFDLGRV